MTKHNIDKVKHAEKTTLMNLKKDDDLMLERAINDLIEIYGNTLDISKVRYKNGIVIYASPCFKGTWERFKDWWSWKKKNINSI